jgi:hypothetical protein
VSHVREGTRPETRGAPDLAGLEATPSAAGWRGACRLGGWAALVSLLASLATLVVVFAVGGPPETAEEAFTLLRDHRIEGLFRLELVSLINVGAYYLWFFGLYAALRRTDVALAALATALAFAGVTLFLTAHPLSSLLTLSDRWAVAGTGAQRVQLLAAGEALLAADMWHSTGAAFGGLIIEVGAILFSLLMLRGVVFSRATAWVGLVTHGLDLSQMALGLVIPAVKVAIMVVAGPLYLVWFFLIGRRLLQLGRRAPGLPV